LPQVLGVGPAAGEHQPRRRDAARLRRGAQALAHAVRFAQQPQHAGGHRAQQAQPQFEHLRTDLVGAVEAAEDEAVLGQAQLGARRRGGGRTRRASLAWKLSGSRTTCSAKSASAPAGVTQRSPRM
jgi:hypothetical protein